MSKLYVDWGGTNFRYEVSAEPGKIVSKPSAEIEIISELQNILKRHPDVKSVGISFAGQVNNNKIYSAPNINTKELDLSEYFNGIHFLVQNDLKCAILAESSYFKESDIAVMYVGTGIGSAYMDAGIVISGSCNTSGEIGHIPYKNTELVCGCGKSNCLELTASGSGLIKKTKLAGIEFDGIESLKASEAGSRILFAFEDGIGYAASLIVTMLNPKILVIGGGVVKSNEYLLEKIKDYVDKNAIKTNTLACDIKLSQLDDGSLDGIKLLLDY